MEARLQRRSEHVRNKRLEGEREYISETANGATRAPKVIVRGDAR